MAAECRASSSSRQRARRWCCCASSMRSITGGAGSLTASAASIGSTRRLAALDLSRSIARLRVIATSQVIGLARRIETVGFAPYCHIYVLQEVLGLASVIQDTETDAKKLRRGVL